MITIITEFGNQVNDVVLSVALDRVRKIYILFIFF